MKDRTQLKEWLEMFLMGRLDFTYLDTQKITQNLAWKNSILGWKTHIL